MCTMNFCLRQLGTLEFWETLLDSFGNLGPIAPIMLAQAGKGTAVGEPL